VSYLRCHRLAVVIAAAAALAAGAAVAVAGPAHVVRLISGSSIKKHSIAGNRLKEDTLTGTQIRESKLGPIPQAVHANGADSAGSAENAGHADNATHADSASDASNLAGAPASSYARGPGGLIFTRVLVPQTASPTTLVVLPGLGTLRGTCHNNSFALDIDYVTPDASPRQDADFSEWDINGALVNHVHMGNPSGGHGFGPNTISGGGGSFEMIAGQSEGTAQGAEIHGVFSKNALDAPCRVTITGTYGP
jgi:hypothetical protein